MPDQAPASLAFRLSGWGVARGSEEWPSARMAQALGVTEEWIARRCGIQTRHLASRDESVASLGGLALRHAMERPGAEPPDIVLCATFTPDHALCPQAPAVAAAAGLGGVGAVDVGAACAGGVAAFLLGVGLLESGLARRVAVVGSDVVSRHLRADDAATRILFSDGACALLLERGAADSSRVLAWELGSDGSGAHLFRAEQGGSIEPRLPCEQPFVSVTMDGPALFRFAVERGSRLVEHLCARARVPLEHVDHVVVHQANARILDRLRAALAIPPERWVSTVAAEGNAGAAAIGIALVSALETGRIRKGDLVVLAAFGAGLSWSGALIRW